MELTIFVLIPKNETNNIAIEFDRNNLANTVRRTAHAIEGGEPLVSGDGGAVLNHERRVIGTWSIK